MTEDVPGLILLLFFDHNVSTIRKVVLKNQCIRTKYHRIGAKASLQINKNRPRIRAALDQQPHSSKAEINSSRGYYSNKYGILNLASYVHVCLFPIHNSSFDDSVVCSIDHQHARQFKLYTPPCSAVSTGSHLNIPPQMPVVVLYWR